MNKSWMLIFIAGLFEIGWVIGLKHAFDLWTWAGTAVAIYVSMHLLILGSKQLPVGTAYAVFTGIGTTGTVLFEILVFGDPFKISKLLLILLLLAGIIGLKTVTTENRTEGERG